MQINKISQNTNFKSKFVPTPELQRTFQIARKGKNTYYAQSISKLLNDGKSDVISFSPQYLRKGVYKGIDLCINGEPQLGIESKYLTTNTSETTIALDIMTLINIFANTPNKEFAECNFKDVIPKLRKAERQIFKNSKV